MPEFSATAIFCEDVRQDVNGPLILIGVLPDKIAAPHFPGGMPMLHIYVRLHFPVEFEPDEVRLRIEDPNGTTLHINVVERSLIEEIILEGRKEGAQIAGVFSHMALQSFNVPSPGRYVVKAEWSRGSFIAGHLQFVLPPPDILMNRPQGSRQTD